MKWKDDPLKDEKYFLFDAIIAFAKKQPGRSFNEICMKELFDFADEHVERFNEML